ncbi:MAG: UPF0158 family protein [Chlamydiales bacterium]|nr:UPF0158 family protein [Chlamydiia bacterium]MCP5507618.1 UPF0158 family protein [Chlamydiales bacterium]
MSKINRPEAQNPLILRAHRLMEAFAKSDDERDFYLDRVEGFIIYVDLDKQEEIIENLEKELKENSDRYCLIPKMTFYETKKIMENFVNEKVYDIDTKEKLLDIIGSKEARDNFLEFIYDHHTELEKWQQYYQERSRIRIIEWLRNNHFHFVFEEDVDVPNAIMEKVKSQLFESKVGKDVATARKTLFSKAKTYYSNEALNPRPKRGRPPKQAAKQDNEPTVSSDIYTTVPTMVRHFLFTPDITLSLATFSTKFETEEELVASIKTHQKEQEDDTLVDINQKLASLRDLSNKWMHTETKVQSNQTELLHETDSESSSEKVKKAKTAPKKSATKAKPKEEKKIPAKKPLRSIIKKKESEPKKESEKSGSKKRIMQPKKAPMRKIIKEK